MLDLSKAFDSISHDILSKKLENLGFSACSLSLIQNYLKYRLQRVCVNGVFSDWTEVERRVPQGTVLGPPLFSQYINDLYRQALPGCKVIQYADDTILFISGKNIDEITSALGENVELLIKYFQSHQLTLNVDKTQFLILCKKNQNKFHKNVTITVNGEQIEQVNEAKYLGVTIDKNLTFDSQVKNVLKKMAMGIKTIYCIRDFVPQRTRNILLQALVLSHFTYSAILFTGITSCLLESLERQLNWGLKACYMKSKYSSSTALKLRSKILPIQSQINFRAIIFFWKLKNNISAAFKSLVFPNYDIKINKRTGVCTFQKTAKTIPEKLTTLSR